MNKRLTELAELYRTTVEAEKETLYIKGKVLYEAKVICKDNGKLWKQWLSESMADGGDAARLIKAHKSGLSKVVPVPHLTKLKLLVPLVEKTAAGLDEYDISKAIEFVDSVGGHEGVTAMPKRELAKKIKEFTGERVPDEEMKKRNEEAWESYKEKNPTKPLSPKAQASINSTLKKVSLKWSGTELTQEGENLLEAVTHIEHWINYLYSKMDNEELKPQIQDFLNQLANKISNPLTQLK